MGGFSYIPIRRSTGHHEAAVSRGLERAGGRLCGRCQTRAVLAQGVVTPATIVTACSAALAPLYNWILVDKLEVGLAGAALANDAVQVRDNTRYAWDQ